ncbi:hypothetical protein JCM17823_18340 [Halorubrum gandharaense]
MSDGERAGSAEGSEPAASGTESGTAPRHDPEELPPEIRENVPDYDDEYLDRVSDRLLFSYDLDADHRIAGERFDLYGELRVRNQKQFLHPALSYANHDQQEFLFARRQSATTVGELERLVALAHDLADERVEADEQHYETEFTVVLVVDDLTDAVAEFVDGFRDRTLLTFGYHGHYEVNLVVVAPDDERLVASEVADVAEAFRLWDPVEPPAEGVFSRFAKRFWR